MYTSSELKLRSNNPISTEAIIKDQIDRDIISEFKINAYNGIQYYNRKNTYINDLINQRNAKNIRNSNKWTSNHKCGSGFLKKIIDQKINYLLGKKVIVNNVDNCNSAFDVNNVIKKAAKEASKKGVEWIHTYIDKQGDFKAININGLECIPVWDTEYENELQQMIRYYYMTIVEDGKEYIRYRVELWDKEKTTFYIQDSAGHFNLDLNIPNNPIYHYNFNTILGDSVVDTIGYGWGKVPFIPVWNNDDKTTDLEAIKPDIDLYDIIKSDFANNIDRFQEAILLIKNHAAQSTEKFITLLKDYGFIEVQEDGDVKWLQLDIPIEARKVFLEIIRDDIFEFGQAVDTRRVADGNTTNVVIKSRYADLDLKCDDLEACVTEAIKELYWFINKYLEITKKAQDDLTKIEIVYNRNIIFNTSEMVDNCLKSKGIISDKTMLTNHPYVNDVEEEMKEIENDIKRSPELNDMDLDNNNNDEK